MEGGDAVSLFREEAIHHQRIRNLGEVIVHVPISYTAMSAFAVGVTVVVFAILFFVSYPVAEHVSGILVPDKGVINLIAKVSGTVQLNNITPGSHVKKGDQLLVIESGSATRETSNIGDLLVRQSTAAQAELRSQIDTESRLTSLQLKSLDRNISLLKGRLLHARQQYDAESKRVLLDGELVTKYAKLMKSKVISEEQYIQIQDKYFGEKANQANLASQIDSISQDILAQESERRSLPLQLKKNLAQYHVQLDQLLQQTAEYQGQAEYVINAPVSGVIATINVNAGQSVSAGAQLFSIIPENSKLQARIAIPVSESGMVAVGDRVALRYDAFPYQEFGVYNATILSISKNTYTTDDNRFPLQINEPYYLATANLQEGQVRLGKERFALRYGLSFKGDVVVQQRSLFDMLFFPIYKLVHT